MTHETLLIDPETGVRLCGGSRALYENMLRRFSHDQTLPRLRAALLDGDLEEAFMQAHSLKGVSAQLALYALYADAGALCDLLREGNLCAPETIRRRLAELEDVHEKTLFAIERLAAGAQIDP